ncbi:hypothetical protein WA577_004268 [Blastocystis sp. JDR]
METAYVSLAEKISKEVNLDSLPYIDKEYDEPGMQDYVDSLIQEEMKTFHPRNYLAEWPMPELKFDSNPELQQEWQRIKEKKPLQGFDVNKYTLEEPSGDIALSEEAWKKSIEAAKIQLEYQKDKMENLQLLEQFGSNAYRMQNDCIDASNEKMDRDLADLQEKTGVVNRKRKMDQEAAGEKLMNTEWQILELQMKNYQIERSCEAMESQLKKQKMETWSVC